MEKSLIEKFLKTNTEFLERFKVIFKSLSRIMIKNLWICSFVIDLLTDRLHYVNIFTLIKKMVKNINDADEFAFFCETDGGKWQIYDSYYDKTKILVKFWFFWIFNEIIKGPWISREIPSCHWKNIYKGYFGNYSWWTKHLQYVDQQS